MSRKKGKKTEYYRLLNELLDEMFYFAERHDLTWADMARLSGVTYQTVCNLGDRWTVFPLLRTVLMLAKGIGFPIRIDFSEMRVA
jgi:Fe-S oxidoreductase